jgi:hypothetical protein
VSVKSADAGYADGDDCHCGLDCCPDGDVDDVVWTMVSLSFFLFLWFASCQGFKLTSEVGHLCWSIKLQQSHQANDVEHEGDDAQCEHSHRSNLQLLVELQAQDLLDRNDDDEKVCDDVRDLEAIVEGQDGYACAGDHRVPVLLHRHTEEEGGQDDAGAPNSDNGDQDVDLPVEVARVMREESSILHQD